MFRFTIRELALVTALVAMGLGWGIHTIRLRTALATTRQELVKARNALLAADKRLLEDVDYFRDIRLLLRSHGLSVVRDADGPKYLRKLNEPRRP